MSFDIAQWIIKIPVVLLAITIHEYAHGRAALWLGDPTAKSMGRLTLNPIPHIDPLGAICLFIFGFGWAKPVPVNPRYFKNVRRDIVIMSLAGPISNLFAAFIAGMLFRHFLLPWSTYLTILALLMFINLGLGLFNLIPLPPLDGSHVLENLLPPRATRKYREFGRYGPFLLFGILILDRFAHTGIISMILFGPVKYLAHLFSGYPLLG